MCGTSGNERGGELNNFLCGNPVNKGGGRFFACGCLGTSGYDCIWLPWDDGEANYFMSSWVAGIFFKSTWISDSPTRQHFVL